MKMKWLAILFIVAIANNACGQNIPTNAQRTLAPSLRECYSNGTLLDRNNLPPATLQVLIDIIRKIEDHPDVNMDLRQLSAVILHTYRQDGIEFHPSNTGVVSSNVLPYSPTYNSYYRHMMLLQSIIPNNNLYLSNNTLPTELKCALHHMLSTTVDARVRGDEHNCNQLSQYRSMRIRRQGVPINRDVEILDLSIMRGIDKNGQMKQYNPKNDVEYKSMNGYRSAQLVGDSSCPILEGVISTPWGAVSAGNLIAGIAAGANLQNIPLSALNYGSTVNSNVVVSSIYPATLSGDLAEAVLTQITDGAGQSITAAGGGHYITVGGAGSWNSTQAHKHYMLHSRTNIEMTDPEIRGDIDGFVLGTSITSILGTSSSLKLSQLLDMFYSERNGVFNPSLRACARKDLATQYIDGTKLQTETLAFSVALDSKMSLPGTITAGLEESVASAVTNFQSYTTNNLNDLNCVTTEASFTDRDYRLRTNLYLVVDASWQYQAIYPAISYLLDSIEVGKYESSVTLLSAFDGSVIINKTFSMADFHVGYTQVRHQSMLVGVNLQTTLTNIQTLMHSELQHEKSTNYVGGNATVLLFLLNTGNLVVSDVVWEAARKLNETVPDLKAIYATASNQYDSLWSIVRDPYNDIKTIGLSTQGTNVDVTMAPVLQRIQKVGRRVVNSNCGSEFHAEWTSGTRQFDDFVEPGYTNFYTVSPNYFYKNNDNTKIRITRSGAGVGSLVVCHSRFVAQPRQNSTIDEDSVQCQTIASTGNVEISLQNACNGYFTIGSCPPLYVSVESNAAAASANSAYCTDAHACRFPYSIRFQVQIEEFGCYSSARAINASLFLIALSILTIKLFKY